ncbi:hypothetical protein RDV89_16400 [Nocardioides zeae]|uniref:Cellulose synthase n=1 Tax=Nocardioides imazamoxiresistens TaxID=3231893 RepID=A0ABU3PZH1_9ACTN|nr:hypothetical protein [Nocardioides zeae]MDT9594668.1 hypothetical protein [Nocardioides zeae]
MDATWLALAAVLTALGIVWTVYAYRSRGVASALRGAGLTLLAPAAYLTGTLELAGEIAVDVGDWASGVVLSPVVWTGIALAGGGVLLFLLGGLLAGRGVGTTPRRAAPAPTPPAGAVGAPGAGGAAGAAAPGGREAERATRPQQAPAAAARPGGKQAPADDDLADIEAILRRRGIE